ncbi:hypothetical protein D3C71_2170090 [compost metagenome]
MILASRRIGQHDSSLVRPVDLVSPVDELLADASFFPIKRTDVILPADLVSVGSLHTGITGDEDCLV